MADRLSEVAILRALALVNTPRSRSSASLRFMTPADHFGRGFVPALDNVRVVRVIRSLSLIVTPPARLNPIGGFNCMESKPRADDH